MYSEHVPQINSAMRSDPDYFARGILFAAMSARCPITRVPEILRDVDTQGAGSRYLGAAKFQCWEWLQTNATDAWQKVTRMDCPNALRYLAHNVPGLGIVKAGFVCQFLRHDIGCLDTHNMRWHKIPARAFCSSNHGKRGRKSGYSEAQFKRYEALACGNARTLWDEWCTKVSGFYEMTPHAISELHMEVAR